MAFIPSKPIHSRYALKHLNSTEYESFAKEYSRAKAGGIRCVYAWSTGAGIWSIVKNLGQGIVIDYGNVVVFTNATKVVSISKAVHGTAAFCFECLEDSSNLVFLPVDLALFGQPIPIGAPNRFNLLNTTDFLDI